MSRATSVIEPLRCTRFVVSGSVQGVGFRYATVRTARELELAGWVRNRADGTVEVLARGADDTLQVFERWLRQGPRLARVSGVSAANSDETVPESFSIR